MEYVFLFIGLVVNKIFRVVGGSIILIIQQELVMKQKAKEGTWLHDRIKLTHWDVQQPYQPHDLGPIHSIAIDKDTKFIQLKALIDEYNHEVIAVKEKKQGIIHGSLKWHFIGTLYLMLHDIAQIKDPDVQKKYLEDVHDWANNYQFNKRSRPITAATRPTSAFTRPNTGTTVTNMRKKLIDMKSQQLHLTEVNKQIKEKQQFQNLLTEQPKKSVEIIKSKPQSATTTKQMSMIADQRKDYRRMFRTIHPHLEVAQERLKEYPRRKRLDIQIQKPTQTVHVPKKPKIQIQKIVKEPDMFEDDLYFAQNLMEEQIPAQEEQPVIQLEPQVQEIPEIDFGGELGDADQQGQPQEVEEDQVLDKLAPRTKVYKDYHAPVHQDTVKISNNRNFKMKNQELKNIIMDAEESKTLKDQWGKSKARWQNEESRKRQALKIGCKSASITVRENILSNNVMDLSKTYHRPLSTARRSSILKDVQKKQYSFNVRNVLDHQLHNVRFAQLQALGNLQITDTQNKSRCLSAFVPSHNRRMQFSQILSRGRQKILSELDSELLEVKQRLAGDRIPMDVPKIRAGISLGEMDVKQIYQQNPFPQINGKSLLNNPFFKISKKKKKKKKKR